MAEKKSKAQLIAIAGLNHGWIPVDKALPPVDQQVAVTTKPKKGERNWNKAYVDKDGCWHGTGTHAEVIAWRPIKPWEG